MKWLVRHSRLTSGVLDVPGDKSISHRALMFAALAEGRSELQNLGPGADVVSTASCLEALGTRVTPVDGWVAVDGGAFRPSADVLDAGNSGTTMRLLSGILAGQSFPSTLTGDDSLRRRPMLRVARPLEEMGARVTTSDGHAPLHINGGGLHGIRYEMPVPSAQVKSCVLLAGLFANGKTTVHETLQTRDHTERMLRATGVPVAQDELSTTVRGGSRPHAFNLSVPGDFSSAAFLLAVGALFEGMIVRDVGINPTRTAFLSVLERMGCRIETTGEEERAGEPVATVTVAPTSLSGIEIGSDEAPEMLDELPLVALLAAVATGDTKVTGAAELRVKESDRIATITSELGRLGADISELSDGFVVRGRGLQGLTGAECEAHGDHRVAMTLSLAGMLAKGETTVNGAESVDISYPSFAATLRSLGANIDEV